MTVHGYLDDDVSLATVFPGQAFDRFLADGIKHKILRFRGQPITDRLLEAIGRSIEPILGRMPATGRPLYRPKVLFEAGGRTIQVFLEEIAMKHFDDPLTLKRLWADLRGTRTHEEAVALVKEHYGEMPFTCLPGDAATADIGMVRVVAVEPTPYVTQPGIAHSFVMLEIENVERTKTEKRSVAIAFTRDAALQT